MHFLPSAALRVSLSDQDRSGATGRSLDEPVMLASFSSSAKDEMSKGDRKLQDSVN
jgi:hypothetical protein